MFPEFWFDGNLYFGWITTEEDFKKLVEAYKSHSTLDSLLSARSKFDNGRAYGFYAEYNRKCLRDFLDENKFDYQVYKF